MLRPALLSCRRCETGGMGDNLMGICLESSRSVKQNDICPSTWWADAGGGSCTDTPRGDTCWRSVGPHGECGFDAGGLPARFRKRPRAGALRSAGTHAAQRRSWAARRRVEYPWIPFRSECEGMRRDQSSPGHFHKFMRTKVCHYAPSSEGALRRGKTSRGSGRLPWKKGEPADSGLGTGYPDGRQRGNRSEPWNYDPRYTLTPD